MDEPASAPSTEELSAYVERAAIEDALACLRTFEATDEGTRKTAIWTLRTIADERPDALAPLVPGFATFLEDEKRSIRLSTAKLFVTVAEAASGAVVDAVPALAARLKDDEEFYYVRARSAEALGYVALEDPGAVATPAVLADLRVGLELDEPEVREKLAKVLAHVALGDPARLRHRVSDLAGHLDDDRELVRYHLCTALVAVGCERPVRLRPAADALAARLDDESAHVRGRAAEAFGLLGWVEAAELPIDALVVAADDEASFAAERARFALAGVERGADRIDPEDGVGSLAAIRERTDEVAAEIAAPEAGCPHCGLALPENGPLACPRCGAPYRR